MRLQWQYGVLDKFRQRLLPTALGVIITVRRKVLFKEIEEFRLVGTDQVHEGAAWCEKGGTEQTKNAV